MPCCGCSDYYWLWQANILDDVIELWLELTYSMQLKVITDIRRVHKPVDVARPSLTMSLNTSCVALSSKEDSAKDLIWKPWPCIEETHILLYLFPHGPCDMSSRVIMLLSIVLFVSIPSVARNNNNNNKTLDAPRNVYSGLQYRVSSINTLSPPLPLASTSRLFCLHIITPLGLMSHTISLRYHTPVRGMDGREEWWGDGEMKSWKPRDGLLSANFSLSFFMCMVSQLTSDRGDWHRLTYQFNLSV